MITAWNPKAQAVWNGWLFFLAKALYTISTSNRALDSQTTATKAFPILQTAAWNLGLIYIHWVCYSDPTSLGCSSSMFFQIANETLQVSSWNHLTACRWEAKVWQKRKTCRNRVVEKKRLLCWVVVWNMFYVYSYFGEMHQFGEHIFQMGWFNHQPVYVWCVFVDFLFQFHFYCIKPPKVETVFWVCWFNKKHRSLKVFEHETGKSLDAFHWMGPEKTSTSYKWSHGTPISRVRYCWWTKSG